MEEAQVIHREVKQYIVDILRPAEHILNRAALGFNDDFDFKEALAALPGAGAVLKQRYLLLLKKHDDYPEIVHKIGCDLKKELKHALKELRNIVDQIGAHCHQTSPTEYDYLFECERQLWQIEDLVTVYSRGNGTVYSVEVVEAQDDTELLRNPAFLVAVIVVLVSKIKPLNDIKKSLFKKLVIALLGEKENHKRLVNVVFLDSKEDPARYRTLDYLEAAEKWLRNLRIL